MPQLKNLSCSIQWSESGAPFQEYGTLYGDGVVETFIIVPNRPQSFTIRLQSRGFIYEGLAAVIFADGNYQTNRNRINLLPAKKDQSLSRTEVDFLIRQKEKPLGDGMYMGREWRFDDHNVVSELPEGVKENHFDNIGMIEILVLRCRTRLLDDGPASPASSGADSDIFCERAPPINPGVATETIALVQEEEKEEAGGFMGLFDGTDDKGSMFGLDGSMPLPGDEWYGYPQYNFPNYPPTVNNHSRFNFHHNMPVHQHLPDTYKMSHSGPTAPRPERRVRFEFGPHGPPPHSHDHRTDPVESRPPSYDRCRHSVYPSHERNSASRYPPQSFPPESPCRYPSAPCNCGSPYHRIDENINMINDFPGPAWSVRPTLPQYEPPNQGYANTHRPESNYQPATVPPTQMYTFMNQQHHPHAMSPYGNTSLHAHWPNMMPVPCYIPANPAWPNQQPYSVPPTNNGTNTGPESGSQQQQPAINQNPDSHPISDVERNNSNNGSSNDQPDSSNDQSQSQEQSQNAEHGGNNNNSTVWVDASNNANAQGDQSNSTGNENLGWGPNDVANNSSNNAAETNWGQSDGNNNSGNVDWIVTKPNDNSSNNNNSNEANKNSNNDNNQYNNSNDDFQNSTNKYNDQNMQGAANPQTPPQSTSSNARPLFGPYGQYYTWEPKRVDAPSPDAEEEPRYDVPKSIADQRGTSKQVQPGQGYLYCKKRSVPEYIDDMKEPYARFVFKYRTKEQVKNELGIEIETEPSGDESIQELQNLDKQELIDMLVRAKSALGGKVPSPPPKPITSGDEFSSDHRLPVPVEPPNYQFLKYQMPPVRRHVSADTQGSSKAVNTSDNTNPNDGYNSNNNENTQQWIGDWKTGGDQQNQPGSWDGAVENNSNAQTVTAKNQEGNQNQQSQIQSQTQNNKEPEHIPIPLPGPPPPQPVRQSNTGPSTSTAGGYLAHTQSGDAPDSWKIQNVSSAASSPASVRPPYNPTNSVIDNWDPPQQGGKSKAKKPQEPIW